MFGNGAHAQLFKCTGKDGKVQYQETPCPAAADEKRLKAPAAGPGPSSERIKSGWEVEQVRAMQDDCARGALDNARRAFNDYLSKAGRTGIAFPEAEFKGSIDGFCGCIVRRVTTSFTFADFRKNAPGIAQKYVVDAMSGGECRPGGIMGDVLDGKIR